MQNEHLLEEKYAVKNLVANLVISVLWDKQAVAAEGDTELHHVKVWREEGVVKAEVAKVR